MEKETFESVKRRVQIEVAKIAEREKNIRVTIKRNDEASFPSPMFEDTAIRENDGLRDRLRELDLKKTQLLAELGQQVLGQ